MTTMKTTMRGHLRVLTLAAAALTCALAPRAGAQEASPGPLVDAAWLAARLGEPDLVILQVGPEELYAREHPPGARRVELGDISAPMPADGGHDQHLVLELPDPDLLRSSLQALGVGDRSRIVVVPSGGWVTPAARVLFTLDWAGLGDRAVLLDGGLEAWRAAGHPVTDEAPAVRPGRLTMALRPDRVVDVDWVREGWLRADAPPQGFALVDGRPGAFYDGLRDDRGKSGHIPGAGSVPWSSLFEETADGVVTLKPLDELRALLAEAGVAPGDTVVAYCHIGQYATAVLLAARVAGHDVRLFDGSMNQWALLDLPVEPGDGEER